MTVHVWGVWSHKHPGGSAGSRQIHRAVLQAGSDKGTGVGNLGQPLSEDMTLLLPSWPGHVALRWGQSWSSRHLSHSCSRALEIICGQDFRT